MSALSEPTCHLEGNKIRVSMMLKVPIDIEIELLGMPSTPSSQGSVTGDSELALDDFSEQVRVLSNRIVAQLFQSGLAVSTVPQTQHD
ncbi:MAG: hypothetical protein DSM106950_40890 [Stigonema ocellatum SAG 48.90 = DSM 106950]|nr:hypothetical protein [Stigonema ocellatum SAG 48.90 = DSM 106950]